MHIFKHADDSRVSKGPFRARASTLVDAAYLQVMYAYSSSCQLRHFQLRHCIVNDVISTSVVWWSLTRTFWPFIVIRSPIAYMYNLNWHRSFDLCKLVDARRRAQCECFPSLTLVWLDASTRVSARRAVWTGLKALSCICDSMYVCLYAR